MTDPARPLDLDHTDPAGVLGGEGVAGGDAGAVVQEAEPPRGGHELTIEVWRSYAEGLSYRLLRRWDGGAVKIDGTVSEGDEVAGFRVVDFPGHAPGLIGLWRESDHLCLCSDTVYTLDPMTGAFGAPRVPLEFANMDTAQAREAVRKLSADPHRRVFDANLIEYQLTQAKLGRMTMLIQAGRQFAYRVARSMAQGTGQMEASMVKAYVCKAAEWVTREAMQIHGGFGYAEDGRVYMYMTNDTQGYAPDPVTGISPSINYGSINQVTLISSEDLVNWTDHGVILNHGPDVSWADVLAVADVSWEDNAGDATAPAPTGCWSAAGQPNPGSAGLSISGCLVRRLVEGIADLSTNFYGRDQCDSWC